MKKIKYLIFSLSLAVGFVACEDAYEIEPLGILDQEATFYEVSDAQTYMNGVYTQMSNMNQIAFTAIFTDEVAPSADWNGSNRETHQMILNSTNSYASAIWLQGHTAVNRVNHLLEGVQFIEINDDAEQVALNNVIAQARFVRAYSYLMLASFFSPDMTDNSALGGILFTHVPESNEVLPRGTNAEIYQLMEEDLAYAFSNLSASNEYIYPTKAAVEALQARMYAYRGMYGPAKTHANNVINNYGISLTEAQPFQLNNFYHASNSTNPYRQIWADIPAGSGYQHEQILTLRSLLNGTPAFQPAGIFYQNSTRCTGSPLWSMSYRVHEILSQNPNDVRLFAFVDPTSNDGACNGGEIMIDKYPGIAGAQLVNSLKLIRLSEMYMIMAEASIAEDNLTAAANYVHAVRQARATEGSVAVPSYAGATEAWADVLKERRIELFAEGHRYVDLRRLGAKANVSIDRDVRDNELPSEATTLPITDHRFTLPIPYAETSVNPNAVQNPGYN